MAINWVDRIKQAEKKLTPWRENARRIVATYRGKENENGNATLNLHHSNIQLYLATVYARTPKPECVRRRKDASDPFGQRLSEAVQRALEYSIDEYDFDDIMESVLVDYGNTALGQVRVRYKPFIEVTGREQIPVTASEALKGDELVTVYTAGGKEVEPDEIIEGPAGPYVEGEPVEEVVYEQVCVEFVPWDRFGWDTDAAVWSQVKWAWIEHVLTGGDLKKDYSLSAEEIKDLPEATKDASGASYIGQKFRVYEVFDKEKREVSIWVEGREDPLKVVEDPYKLEGFFPFPKPLLGTVTSDKLVPVPNYQIAQDLYRELNEVTRRIIALTSQLKVRGAYDAQYQDVLKDILIRDDGYLAPLPNLSDLKERGGIKGAIDFLPLEEIHGTLQTLLNNRENLIQKIYEVTGFSDIARGSSRASESAAAQKIKNEHYSTRVNREVRKVSRFVRDVFRLIAEFMCETFSVDTFNLIAQSDLSEDEFAQLKADRSREYLIDVQTDSMLVEDEQAEGELRAQATNAISQFLGMAMPFVQQGMMSPDACKAMVLYNVRSSSRGRGELEKVVESMFTAPPAQPPPQ